MNKAVTVTFWGLLLAAMGGSAPAGGRANAEPVPKGKTQLSPSGGYAVVVSKATSSDPRWAEAVAALKEKHDATVLLHEGDVESVRDELAILSPGYVCFVCRPEECGRGFVRTVHQLTRALDDDPYGDAVWAIITGYEAADALRVVKEGEPLRVKRALGGSISPKSPGWLSYFWEGVGYSETDPRAMWQKPAGAEPVPSKDRPVDTTKRLVDELNTNKIDFFWTSGHATEHDWQIGYRYRNGQFRHKNGQLFGLDTAGKRHPINSTNPKIYDTHGNCLIGHVPGRDCMVTSWFHTGGACMMIGYTVPTWYGFAGRSASYFFERGDAHTYAEAFFFNSQALLFALEERIPEVWDNQRNRRGHQHDRDVVALFGDPAWDARLYVSEEHRPHTCDQELAVTPRGGRDSEMTFTVRILKDTKADVTRPLASFLPFRIGQVSPESVTATEKRAGKPDSPGSAVGKTLVADNFVMLQLRGPLSAGERFSITFPATRLRRWEVGAVGNVLRRLEALAKEKQPLEIDVTTGKLAKMLGIRLSQQGWALLCDRLREAASDQAIDPNLEHLKVSVKWIGKPEDEVRSERWSLADGLSLWPQEGARRCTCPRRDFGRQAC